MIPEDVKSKISSESNERYKNLYNLSAEMWTSNQLVDRLIKSFSAGAEFGYSLSLQTIQDKDRGIAKLEALLEITEDQRKSWADMCIRKQALLDEMIANK